MNSENESPADEGMPMLPEKNLEVDYGKPEPGSKDPMPEDRRAKYEERIRNSVDAQAAGAEKASTLFIR